MLRKKPTQDRSKQRVERIVQVAMEVFAESGFADATTEAIAERAGVSIGSLYQFFPNKRAIFDAVWERYSNEIRTLFDAFMTDERLAEPWEKVLDETVDAFAWHQRSSPGFRAVYRAYLSVPGLVSAGEALNREIARGLERVIAHYAKMSPKRRALVATVVVETLSQMLVIALRSDEAPGNAILAETKVLLRRYLAPYVTER